MDAEEKLDSVPALRLEGNKLFQVNAKHKQAVPGKQAVSGKH